MRHSCRGPSVSNSQVKEYGVFYGEALDGPSRYDNLQL